MDGNQGSSQKLQNLEEELNRIEGIAKGEGVNTQTTQTKVSPESPVAPPADPNPLESNPAEVNVPKPTPEQEVPNSVQNPDPNPISEPANPVKPDFTQELQPEENNPQPLTGDKKSSKTIMLIVVILFILSLVGLAVYYFGSKRSEVTEEPVPVETFVPSPTSTTDPTTGWKTYTSDKGFMFKYPIDAKVDFSQQEDAVKLQIWGPSQKEGTELYDGIGISFKAGSITAGKTLKDIVDNLFSQYSQMPDAKVIQEVAVYKAQDLSGYNFIIELMGKTTYLILQDSLNQTEYVVITEMYVDPSNKGFELTVNQILSTLQFIESTATPSSSPSSSPSASPTATP